MAARLILNADDFGLTRGINRAIAELHRAGALTSATLMASGPAFEDAVALSQANPALGVGCHIVLVDGTPVSPPEKIPSLLAPRSNPNQPAFRSSLLDFTRSLLLGTIRPSEIETEAIAQIHRLQNAAIHVTHLDSHKHTHIFPSVARAILSAAERTGVPAIRNPFEPPFASGLAHAPLKRRLQLALLTRLRSRSPLRNSPILTTSGTIGISATGTLNRDTLNQLLASLPASGDLELCCHPGYNDSDLDLIATRLRTHRETEYHALLAAIPALTANPHAPSLIHYGDLPTSRPFRAASETSCPPVS